MSTLPVDPSQAVKEAARSELIQRKLDMDALRSRLGDTSTKQEKLRESCEGFEAIFLQKMWEQMRKNVPKEGYLHSKDEEAYQSMFDVELCKKMASAGGIGLADMLYEQLSQQLENTGRTTRPGSYRQFLPVPPSDTLMAAAPARESAPAVAAAPTGKLSADDLYTPLYQEQEQEAPEQNAKAPGSSTILGALDELKAELGMAPKDAPGTAVREWAAARDAAGGLTPPPTDAAVNPALAARAGGQTAGQTAAPTPGQTTAAAGAPRQAAAVDPAPASWKGPGPVSAKPKSDHLFGRDKNAAQAKLAETQSKPPAPPKGMAPSDTLWPLPGGEGAVVSRFGWTDDPASGKRHWNSGVEIAATPDTPVRAVLPGTVVYSGQREGFGHTVVLEHRDGYRSYYSNLQQNSVKIGDQIRHGAEFARVAVQTSPAMQGEKSASLHFELKKGEMALNPESAIQRSDAVSG